jgi:hypothetical protein
MAVMLKRLPRLGLALAAVLAGGLVSGCGSDPYQMASVRGRVTCDGKPATGAIVIFQPLDAPDKTGRPAGFSGTASNGTVEKDGTFTLMAMDGKSGAGALIGPHQVFFQPPPTRRPTLSADDRASMSPEEIRAAEESNRRLPIYPPLPCSDQITPSEVEVKAGDNEFEFTLSPRR